MSGDPLYAPVPGGAPHEEPAGGSGWHGIGLGLAGAVVFHALAVAVCVPLDRSGGMGGFGAMLLAVGLVFLFNATCWGAIAAMGAR